MFGFVALNVMAYNHAKAMTHFATGGPRTNKPEDLSGFSKLKVLFTGIKIPRPKGNELASDFADNCEVLLIHELGGIILESWYCDQGNLTPLVILFHGYSADKTSLLAEAGAFLDMGNSVMLVDFRGSGGSSESYTTIGVQEADDVITVAKYAKDKFSHTSIILYGKSMGAVAILRAAKDRKIEVDAVILEAVFDTMLNTTRNRFRVMNVPSFLSAELLVFWGGWQWGFNGFAHNPIEYASSLHSPALFMHGEEDPRATLEEGRCVFDAVPGTKEFVTFEKAGHESYFLSNPVKWQQAVESVIKKTENKSRE